jgi:hypothetical protein
MSEQAVQELEEVRAQLEVALEALRAKNNELAIERAASYAVRRELEYVGFNLTAVQARCTELIQEVRLLKKIHA